MIQIHQEYLTDENGNKWAVVVPIYEWLQLLEELEESDDIRCYDEAKSILSEIIPFEEAIRHIRKREINFQ